MHQPNKRFRSRAHPSCDLPGATDFLPVLPDAALRYGGEPAQTTVEIQGGMLSLPQMLTTDPWRSAWSEAQIGVQATGLKPYFINSILMVVPAVLSRRSRCTQRLCAVKVPFQIRQNRIRLVAVQLLHPVSDRIDPDC